MYCWIWLTTGDQFQRRNLSCPCVLTLIGTVPAYFLDSLSPHPPKLMLFQLCSQELLSCKYMNSIVCLTHERLFRKVHQEDFNTLILATTAKNTKGGGHLLYFIRYLHSHFTYIQVILYEQIARPISCLQKVGRTINKDSCLHFIHSKSCGLIFLKTYFI